MQERESITFTPIVHKPVLHLWEIVIGVLVFVVVLYFAIWSRRKKAQSGSGTLNLRQK